MPVPSVAAGPGMKLAQIDLRTLSIVQREGRITELALTDWPERMPSPNDGWRMNGPYGVKLSAAF